MAEQNPNLVPLLKKIATENNIKNSLIRTTPLSTGGANYSSRLYLAVVTGDSPHELRLFIKAAVMGETIRKQTDLSLYENERLFYTNLLEKYRQLEKRHGIPEEHHMKFPKFYGADDTYLHEIIVLEDLSSQGYVLHDRLQSVSWEYATAAITELAKFHALSICFKHEHPNEFKEISDRCRYKLFNDLEQSEIFYNEMSKKAMAAARAENKNKLKAILDQYNLRKYIDLFDSNRCSVLAHADFRPSNMLHRPKQKGAVDLRVVDYQTISYGSPLTDLMYFIFTATDRPFRTIYYGELVHHYHAELSRALARLDLDVENEFSPKDFQLELQEKLPFGLLLSILLLPLCTVDATEAPSVESELDFSDMCHLAASDLYTARLNEVIDDYVAWGILS